MNVPNPEIPNIENWDDQDIDFEERDYVLEAMRNLGWAHELRNT